MDIEPFYDGYPIVRCMESGLWVVQPREQSQGHMVERSVEDIGKSVPWLIRMIAERWKKLPSQSDTMFHTKYFSPFEENGWRMGQCSPKNQRRIRGKY